MLKIDVNHLQRVLQFQAERRRGRLAIIAMLGWTSFAVGTDFSGIKLASILGSWL
jgi:hypothetical protein